MRTGLAHVQEALSAVAAHAGEQHAHRIFPGMQGHRVKQHVNRGTVPVDRVFLVDLSHIVGPATPERQMEFTRGNVGMARQDSLTLHRLRDANPANVVEALSEGARETGRHVLGNHDGRTVWRQWQQEFTNGFGTAGRGANDDEFFSAQPGVVQHRRLGCWLGRDARAAVFGWRQLGHRSGSNFPSDQFRVGQQTIANAQAGLGDKVDRAEFQRAQGGFGPVFGQ